jgi:NADH dehydrogenase
LNFLGANPTKATPLAYSKWLTEETVKRSGLGYTVLRSSVIIGEDDRFLSPLIRCLRHALMLPLPGLGRIRLQPVWVGDVVRCLLQCLEDPHAAGRTYAIGGPEIFTFRDLMRRLLRLLGAPRLLLPSPLWLFRSVFRRDHSHSLTMMAELSASGRDSITDPAAVANSFQFQPRPFDDVLASMLSKAERNSTELKRA